MFSKDEDEDDSETKKYNPEIMGDIQYRKGADRVGISIDGEGDFLFRPLSQLQTIRLFRVSNN